MDDTKKMTWILIFGVPVILFFVMFSALICGESAGGSDEVAVVTQEDFGIPFDTKVIFSVSSPFGNRLDPFGSGSTKFHSGMDLATAGGTPVLASADGIVYEVGYSPTGLGNYVYIKHQTPDGVLFTAYGHMMDNSIVVEKDQPIKKGTKIGLVGSTGSSTGNHLHFMVMKDKISFNKNDLIDPHYIIYGLH